MLSKHGKAKLYSPPEAGKLGESLPTVVSTQHRYEQPGVLTFALAGKHTRVRISEKKLLLGKFRYNYALEGGLNWAFPSGPSTLNPPFHLLQAGLSAADVQAWLDRGIIAR